jgi:ribose/xylose/arabinose/galactoside ABC-type transport system permease subunit
MSDLTLHGTMSQTVGWLKSRPYIGPLAATIAIALALSVVSPHFFDSNNFVNIANQITVNIILAVGMTILITSG